jgi:DNA modification methylase
VNERIKILNGDALEMLRTLPDKSVQCCVTSPPYWGLRDYGVAGQIGLEATPEIFVRKMVEVFREVRRVLKGDGTCWVNLGDSYAQDKKWGGASGGKNYTSHGGGYSRERKFSGLKPKDLVGIPWRVAFALQADGWWLRSDIIWHKPNPMPESVTDRPTKAHEYIFLLTKSERYFYDAEAIKEESSWDSGDTKMPDGWDTGEGGHGSFHRNGREKGGRKTDKQRGHSRRHAGFNDRWDEMEKAQQCSGKRNKRDVWTVGTFAFPEAHFATYPPDLIKPCILAGSRAGEVVLDPFGGSGTTGQVALELGRRAIIIELNPKYVKLIENRTRQLGLELH